MRTIRTRTKRKRILCLGLAFLMSLMTLAACLQGRTSPSPSIPVPSENGEITSNDPSGGKEPGPVEEPTAGSEAHPSSSEEPSSGSEEPSSSSGGPSPTGDEPSPDVEEPSLSSEEPDSSVEELLTTEPTSGPVPGTREFYENNAYFCTVKTDSRIVASLYTEGKEIPDVLSGVFYTSRSPGGEPTRENGGLWLCLKPDKGYSIASVNVEGAYTKIVDLGRDIYLVRGVNSGITVTASSKATPNAPGGSTLFASYGYGISDSGRLNLSWSEAEGEPIRYVEISISYGGVTRTKLYDGALGGCDFMKLAKNTACTVRLKCYGYNHVGSEVSVNTCYVPDARSVAFPRVEITTEDYIWPTCEYVSPPAGNIGAGISNATWENSVVKIYDASNNVVYDSSEDLTGEKQFSGAKMKIRGNTSAYGVKKPYKIKLSKKCDLLAPFIDRPEDGRSYADKEWLLLNYGTDIYRIAGDAIADVVGTPWSPDYTYVSLYVNGDFRGLYVLSECVKQGSGKEGSRWRCPVDDDGFVIECDAYWWNEPMYFTTPSTENFVMKYTFKYPDTDDFDENSDCYKYIKNYMTELEAALAANDSSYLDYIDLDSFVSWILVADYMCLLDSGGNNLFMWKKDSTESSKLVMGPNWDFDSWKWNIDSFANIHRDGSHFYFPQLSRKQEFAKAYTELFRNTCDKVVDAVNDALDTIDEAEYNELCRLEGARYWSGSQNLSAMRRSFNKWMQAHLEWMESQIG